MSTIEAPGVETMTLTLNEGYDVTVYVCGDGPETLFLANGGPGLPCRYLLEPHLRMAGGRYRVVAWDQLGCGSSDKPQDDALWTLERYVAEAEQVRIAVGADKIHFLGHSWGTWMGTEYCLTFPENVASYIIADGACDIPHLVSELNRLRAALGSETMTMMIGHEAAGTIDHPEYQAAITVLNYRHVCRLAEWPESLTASLEDWNMGPYMAMQGPNEFTYTGNMKDWNRVPAMKDIAVPCLVVAGKYDELTPACAHKMYAALLNAEIRIFDHSSHMPFYEEPEAYFEVLQAFLDKH